MRVTREKAAQNRERIVTEAARLFREHGLAGIGVDALTEAAGLTYGSLYSQFGSKERLAAEAVSHALATSAAIPSWGEKTGSGRYPRTSIVPGDRWVEPTPRARMQTRAPLSAKRAPATSPAVPAPSTTTS